LIEFPLDDPSPVEGVDLDPVPASEFQLKWLISTNFKLDNQAEKHN
jgi:hypothetical protein